MTVAVAQEKLAVILPELQSMLPEQHIYIGGLQLPPDPAWEVYARLESIDKVAFFIARQDDLAVGYSVAMLHRGLNAVHTWVGTIATYYVVETPWRGLILRRLLTTAKDWLCDKGAQQVYIRTEYQHSAGSLIERMGFTPVDIGYKMVFPAGGVAGRG